MKINQSKIAEQVGVDKGFVNFVLEGRRNPNTAKGMQVVLAAAEQYAEVCKAEYVAAALRKWRLYESTGHKVKGLKRHSSDYKGVAWHERRGKWLSQIWNGKKNNHLGYFDTEQEAADAYKQAKLNKENAKTNQPT